MFLSSQQVLIVLAIFMSYNTNTVMADIILVKEILIYI